MTTDTVEEFDTTTLMLLSPGDVAETAPVFGFSKEPLLMQVVESSDKGTRVRLSLHGVFLGHKLLKIDKEGKVAWS